MKKTYLFLLLSLFSTCLISGTKHWDVRHDVNQVMFSEYEGYDNLSISGGRSFFPSGSPSLPSISLLFSFPSTSKLISVSIEDDKWITIGSYNLLPTQPPIPYGLEPEFVSEDEEIYSQNEYYPEKQIVSFNTGNKSGFMIGGVVYCPFRYNPVTEQLQILQSGKLVLKYEEGLENVVYLTEEQHRIFCEDVKGLVENPEEVVINSPLIRESRNPTTEYLIVTPAELVNSFQPLVEWKIQKGIRADVVSKEWVLSNYNGYDDLEKIREMVKDYHQNHGLIYFVMAGDFDNLGARLVPIKSIDGAIYYDTTPSDLYFSDVVPYSSDWDANNNYVYGEFEIDSCDWYSDVYVGRFPVNTTIEVERWVNKVIVYEFDPPTGFIERSIMGGAYLYQNIFGSTVCDSIVNYLPKYWDHLKMYQIDKYSPAPEGFADSLSQGYGWCHIAAHGSYCAIGWCYANGMHEIMLDNSLANNLSNSMKLGVIHATSCHPGYFDWNLFVDDCLAEYLFNSENGGAIAVIMNARYGIGDSPGFGPSDWMSVWTAMEVFSNENWNIGAGYGLGKDHIINGMGINEHWCLTELNLFGDPETQIHSSELETMYVNHNLVVPIGSNTFMVYVSSAKGPLNNATCCMYNPEDSTEYFKSNTNIMGIANISYNIQDSCNVILNIYEHNHVFYSDTIPTSDSSSYVVFVEIDSILGGNENNQINSGCTYEMLIKVSNFGSINANNVKGIISSTDPNITIYPDTLIFGDISPNDTIISVNTAGFSINNGLEDSTVISTELLCWDESYNYWKSLIVLYVNSPNIGINSIEGPLTLVPGDSFYISTELENYGSGTAYNLEFNIRIDDQNITVLDSIEEISFIGPNTKIKLDSVFLVSILPTCPQPYFTDMELSIHLDGGYDLFDTMTICIGTIISEDFESGDTIWNFSGPTSWHLTNHKHHSGSFSMYCGEEGLWNYSNMVINSRVISPLLTVNSSSQLTFWHCYNIFDNFDKVQVQTSIDSGGNWNLIYPEEGYTGQWGYAPCDSIYTGNHMVWEKQHFLIDSTDEINICWLFFSNNEGVEEGYYFDDVNLTLNSGFVGLEEINDYPSHMIEIFELKKVYPNPLRGHAIIEYSIGVKQSVKLIIYDISGREVNTLINQVQEPGFYRAEWDCRDYRGYLVPSGNYYYRLSAGSLSDCKKFIVIR